MCYMALVQDKVSSSPSKSRRLETSPWMTIFSVSKQVEYGLDDVHTLDFSNSNTKTFWPFYQSLVNQVLR